MIVAEREPETDREETVGLECRSCGCRHLPVTYTRKRADGKIIRGRTCRHCGRRMITVEKESGTP